ncbi:MAG: hypothetical protein EB160_07345, partial [Nitrososphaeria archaeon]|nr:hypothetical protein [Nitrososphaeria archaeon]
KDQDLIEIKNKNFLFKVFAHKNDYTVKNGYVSMELLMTKLDPAKSDLYQKIGNLDGSVNAAVIMPEFTASAYYQNGFYDYYNSKCDKSCLKVPLVAYYQQTSSVESLNVLSVLGYKLIADSTVSKNPEIVKKYDKLIVLHNEYVTQKEFDAITKHPKVIYLYPNALYAKVRLNSDNSISLIRGHGYPEKTISNGFSWKYDNSPMEYNKTCVEMNFTKIDNGIMLNCYPERQILMDQKLLEIIKNY